MNGQLTKYSDRRWSYRTRTRAYYFESHPRPAGNPTMVITVGFPDGRLTYGPGEPWDRLFWFSDPPEGIKTFNKCLEENYAMPATVNAMVAFIHMTEGRA